MDLRTYTATPANVAKLKCYYMMKLSVIVIIDKQHLKFISKSNLTKLLARNMGNKVSGHDDDINSKKSSRSEMSNKAVDHFSDQLYSTGPKLSAVRQLLSTMDGVEAFLSFLEQQRVNENLTFMEEMEQLDQLDSTELTNCANLITTSLTARSRDIRRSPPEKLTALTRKLNATKNEKHVLIMAMNSVNDFVRSEHYSKMRAEQRKLLEEKLIVSRHNSRDRMDSKADDTVPPTMTPTPFNYNNMNNNKNANANLSIVDRALASVDSGEVDRLMKTGSWLTSLLAAVETLPVCVSLSTARRDRPGFPLIYVNACFEYTTQYPRSEIVGQNCRFLQAGKAEPESIARLSTALRDAQPVKVAITNFRRDGTPFKNLLAMKPIFDEEGNYRYVLGVQFDVTQDDATPAKLKLADELLRMLPNTIYSNPDE
eukprot:gene15186-20456_t